MINKDINIKVLSNSMVILNDKTVLGISGENLQGKIIFSFEEFVDGVAWLEIEKENGEKGYIQMTKENETYTLEIKSSLLNQAGYIYMQLRITQDENVNGIPVFKSKKFYVEVLNAINATATIEDDYPSIIDIVNNKLETDDILAGENITIEKSGKKLTISSTGGGSGGVSKTYVDEQDTKTLENAKEYADKQVPSAVEAYVNEHKEELKGNKGDKGDTGPQGPQGEQGPKGESGKITDEEKKEIEENVTNNLTDVINNKQDKLVSSENIKTINNQSILGAGNISISESEKELKSKSVKLTEEVNQIFLETDDFDVCFINVKTNSSTCEYKIIYHNTNAPTQYRDYTTQSSSKAQYR